MVEKGEIVEIITNVAALVFLIPLTAIVLTFLLLLFFSVLSSVVQLVSLWMANDKDLYLLFKILIVVYIRPRSLGGLLFLLVILGVVNVFLG